MNHKSTILIVDDQLSAREVLRGLLTEQGYNLTFAGSGDEALHKAVELRQDRIWLDVLMRGMEGLEVWNWDNKAKTYRTWWFSSMGDAGQGTARYDEESGEWHTSGVGTNPMTGKTGYGQGTIKMTDDNSMEWTWKEWDNMLHFGSPMTMKGKSTKK